MKTNLSLGRTLVVVAGLALLACAGCLEKRIVWSPDGARAAVVSEEGLYLCGADGRLSALVAPHVYAVAWFDDSQRLAFARRHEVREWSEAADALGDRRQPIVAAAEAYWRDFESGAPWGNIVERTRKQPEVQLCLRAAHAEALKSRLSAADWSALRALTLDLHEIVVARIEGDGLVIEGVRHTGVHGIVDIRVAPGGSAIAFTEDNPSNDAAALCLGATAGNSTPVEVSDRCAGYPDWSPAGDAIVYVDAASSAPKDVLVLGVVTRRKVGHNAGGLALQGDPDYLAGVVFNSLTHVRCLRDGRILFNAAELSLPIAAADYGGEQREQLFALDPGRESTLIRLVPRKHESNLPQDLAFFEVSPSEKQVVFGGAKGEVAVLTLATGDVATIQPAADRTFAGLPAWRTADEFTYVRRTAKPKEGSPGRPAEIVAWCDGKERVVSANWPDVIVASVAKENSR